MPISWSRFSLCSLFKYYNMVNLVRWKSQCGWPSIFPQLSRAKDALSINVSFWFSNTCIISLSVRPCPTMSVRTPIHMTFRSPNRVHLAFPKIKTISPCPILGSLTKIRVHCYLPKAIQAKNLSFDNIIWEWMSKEWKAE